MGEIKIKAESLTELWRIITVLCDFTLSDMSEPFVSRLWQKHTKQTKYTDDEAIVGYQGNGKIVRMDYETGGTNPHVNVSSRHGYFKITASSLNLTTVGIYVNEFSDSKSKFHKHCCKNNEHLIETVEWLNKRGYLSKETYGQFMRKLRFR